MEADKRVSTDAPGQHRRLRQPHHLGGRGAQMVVAWCRESLLGEYVLDHRTLYLRNASPAQAPIVKVAKKAAR